MKEKKITLRKYCKEQHNIAKECRTIQISTLRSYDQDDPNFLRGDPNEGITRFIDENGKKIELDAKQLMSEGKFFTSEDRTSFYYKAPNVYIFSLTMDQEHCEENCKAIDPKYDDSYEIDDIGLFAKFIGSSLVKMITAENINFNALIDPDHSALNGIDCKDPRSISSYPIYRKKIGCCIRHKKVQYYDTKEFSPDPDGNNFNKYTETCSDKKMLYSMKHIKYKKLNEYRIEAILCIKTGFEGSDRVTIIPVKDNSKLIKIPDDIPTIARLITCPLKEILNMSGIMV